MKRILHIRYSLGIRSRPNIVGDGYCLLQLKIPRSSARNKSVREVEQGSEPASVSVGEFVTYIGFGNVGDRAHGITPIGLWVVGARGEDRPGIN